MAKIFNTLVKIQKVKQPLFQIYRTKYRGVRNSQLENSEINLLKLDLTRINLQLDEVDTSIVEHLTLIVGDKKNINLQVNLNDGLSSEIDGVDIKFEDLSLEEDISIDSLDKLSGQVSRMITKINRLEKGV